MTEPSAGASALDAWLRSALADLLAPIAAEQQAQRAILERLLPATPAAPPDHVTPAEPDPAPVIVEPEPELSLPAVATPTTDAGGPVCQVEITSASGKAWPLDLMTAPSEDQRKGPYGYQRRTLAEVPAAIAGCTSLRVVVDWGMASNGVLWADCWFRNDISMRDGGGEARYSARVVLDGLEVLRQDNVVHGQYRAWGRLVSAGTLPDLALPSRAALAAAGVANYSGPVDEAVITRYATAMAAWSDDIWCERGIAKYMPGVGGRDDIGPATAPQAIALMTRDPRMVAYVVAQAEAAGTIPWHHWDAEAGTYMRVTDWPRLWTDSRGGERGKGTLLQPVPGDTGWDLDSAHQPDLSFVPYLLTGRRAFLDELQAQSAWNVIAQWQDTRGDSDMLVVNGGQVRGSAWALRQIDEAAWASPEGSLEKAYFSAVSDANWTWIVQQLPAWSEMQGEARGWFVGTYGTDGALPPWQQDYFASTAIAAARRGNEDAKTYLRWARTFLVGRFAALGHDAATYLLAISEGARTFTTWAEIKAETEARDWSNSTGWSHIDGNYAQWARWTLAGYSDLFGDVEARRLFESLPAEGAPFTQPADYARDPLLSVALAE